MDGEMKEGKVEGVGEEEVKERRRKETQDKQCRMKDKLDWTRWLTSCLQNNYLPPKESKKGNRYEVRREHRTIQHDFIDR